MEGTSVVPLAIRTPAVDVINLSLDKSFLYSDGIFYPQKRSCVCYWRRFFMLTPCCCLSDGAELNKVEIWPPFAQWHCQKIYLKNKSCQASEVINAFQWIPHCSFLSLHSPILKSEKNNLKTMSKMGLPANILTLKIHLLLYFFPHVCLWIYVRTNNIYVVDTVSHAVNNLK